jgi:thiol-disulfide isomerase/thioredoxin
MKKILALSICMAFLACKQNNEQVVELSPEAMAAVNHHQEPQPKNEAAVSEEITELNAADLADLAKPYDDEKVHVLNFFATWCGSCMREIPDFIDLMKADKAQKLDILFVNFGDDPNAWFTDVQSFAQQNGIQKQIRYVNAASNPTAFAQQVSKKWDGGAIPFTLMLYKNKRLEFQGALSKAELQKAIADIQK